MAGDERPEVTGDPEVIQAFESTGALLQGHFELRSGLHSNWYFQCARLMQYPQILEAMCRRLVEKVQQVAPAARNADLVASPAVGAIILGYEMARVLRCRSVFLEKEGDSLVLRRNFEIREGERVLIAEDVVTRGGRVLQTAEAVEEHGGKVLAIAVLVDRRDDSVILPYPVASLIRAQPQVWQPDECPLCRRGQQLEHPGSK